MPIELRYYQLEAVQALWDYFCNYTGNPVVAMPTGTGKSLVIAEFLRRACASYPSVRAITLTHVKEIASQDLRALKSIWPKVNTGVHSAGLRKRDTKHQLLFGTMQSVRSTLKRQPDVFGYRDFLIIDEAHLLSDKDESTYQQIIAALKRTNPLLKVIGFSATPWRTKGGLLTNEGGLFTHICYDITQPEAFAKLIAEGYLCTLIPKHTQTQIDVSLVQTVAGEFNKNQLEDAVNRDDITLGAVRELIYFGHNRRRWLVFTSGVESAENVASMLEAEGVNAACVHSKKKSTTNDLLIDQFQTGHLQCLVNSDMLTTGFDCPEIDLIGMLRPTRSSRLWVQMLGRGTRPAPGKSNCLVLDFAGNTRRLGPINSVTIPPPPGQKAKVGDAPVKICEQCGVYNHAGVKICFCCGAEFNFESKVESQASTLELIAGGQIEVALIDVQHVVYGLHKKSGKPDSIKVSYFCQGFRPYNEYICLEHSGYAARRAQQWWQQRCAGEVPKTAIDALRKVSELRKPARIKVWTNKKPYPEVLSAEW